MVRRVLQERDELIQEYGLVLIGEENGEESYDDMEDEERTSDTIMDLSPRKIGVKKALLSQEASELLSKGAAKGSLDVRLRKYAEDKHELEDEVRRLKLVLEEELSNKRRENGLDYEKHKETTKSLNEFKFKIQKAEAEVSTLQANVARLESLVARYKASTEELEKSEEELKSEKRRLQREYV
ncbi:Leucine-rich repeat flightless-interacting protein 2 [Armadillidium vulgare]|nr:Leucine-rich repeat flightless-interacting protein 2 [Armadillidium vulgare]